MEHGRFTAFYDSPLGRLKVSGEGSGIRGISMNESGRAEGAMPLRIRKSLDLYFGGSRKKSGTRFLLTGTPFQKKVWKSLSTIPWGERISYAQLARRVKRPGAARAVAGAAGKNPVAILLPCHRVVGSDGSLTGYAYGLKKKQWLLDHEKRHG